MYTYCVNCGVTIYDNQIDLCDDCEHKYKLIPSPGWRYEMHHEIAEDWMRKMAERQEKLN